MMRDSCIDSGPLLFGFGVEKNKTKCQQQNGDAARCVVVTVSGLLVVRYGGFGVNGQQNKMAIAK